MKNIKEIASQPSNADGSLQERVGVTKLLRNYIETGRLVEHMDGSVTFDAVTYRPNPTAALVQVLSTNLGNIPALLAMFERDFAIAMQMEAFDNANKVKLKAKPLTGHYLSSEQYLESCFALLPELPEPDYIGALARLVDIKDSMTKNDILAIVREVILLVQVKEYTTADLTSEQSAKYFDLVHKEQALSVASEVLSPYLDKIKPISDTGLQGRFYPERGQGQELLTLIDQEKWSILVNTPVPAKLEGLTISEPGYNLISIQVVEVQA